MMQPLAGITVVAIEQAVAAPFATRQLADLGARVIKIERPDGGDFARHYDATVKGLSSYFVWLNRSKESLTLDLKRPESAAVLSGLLERADVFVQNLAPGAADRRGDVRLFGNPDRASRSRNDRTRNRARRVALRRARRVDEPCGVLHGLQRRAAATDRRRPRVDCPLWTDSRG